jgi:dihydrolipoamide dehydrogenase
MADLVVVGGGPAGYSAAIHAAIGGRSVVLIESDAVGGVCLNRGCIPMKTLLEESRRGGGQSPAAACSRASQELVRGVEENLRRSGVTLVRGEATMEHAGVVTVGGASVGRFEGSLVLAASGSAPCFPAPLRRIPERVVTVEEFLGRPTVPRSCVVVGGGPSGVEVAQALRGFGCAVTVLEAATCILPSVDGELSRVAVRHWEADGISFLTGMQVADLSIGREEVGLVLSDGSPLAAELVIVAAGRKSRLDWADWEALGVVRKGDYLATDAWCRTANPVVAAAGDIVGPWRFAHTAYHQGLRAVASCIGPLPDLPPDCDAGTPRVVYGDPEIVEVGSFPGDARVGRFPYAISGRARTTGRTEGFVKAAVGADGVIVGFGLVGWDVSEQADLAGFLVQNRVPAERYLTSVHPHPTLSEAVSEAIGVALGVSVHRLRGARR